MTRPARDPAGRGRAVAVYLTPTEERRLRAAADLRDLANTIEEDRDDG